MKRNYWLKMVGAARWPLEDRSIERCRSFCAACGRPGSLPGSPSTNYLVYYSAGTQKLFAIARASENGESASIVPGPGQDDWPYLMPVQVLLAFPQLALAPDWRVLGTKNTSVQQKSYLQIGHRNTRRRRRQSSPEPQRPMSQPALEREYDEATLTSPTLGRRWSRSGSGSGRAVCGSAGLCVITH